jgi:hypothetical protein
VGKKPHPLATLGKSASAALGFLAAAILRCGYLRVAFGSRTIGFVSRLSSSSPTNDFLPGYRSDALSLGT